jgi:hypothetical protein
MRGGIREVILLKDRIDEPRSHVKNAADTLVDHDRRLVRIETIIELARRTRLPSDR